MNRCVRRTSGALAWLAVFSLTACSTIKKINAPSPEQTQLQSHMSILQDKQIIVAQKTKELAQLKIDQKTVLRQIKEDQKQIPLLLGQSDDALRQTQRYKNMIAKSKKSNVKIITAGVETSKAQKVADDKAALLITTRRDLYASFDKAAGLQKQIKAVAAQKETAERGAKLEAVAIEQLKKPGKTSMASTNSLKHL